MTSHTDIITFKAEDFAHLSPEEGQLVRLLVYRQDYRLEVMRLREELEINRFRKEFPEATDLKSIYSAFENDRLPLGIYVPIMQAHEKLGVSNPIWMRFTYILIVCDKIDRPTLESRRPGTEYSKKLETDYKKLNELLLKGERIEAGEILARFNHSTIFESSRIKVWVHDPRADLTPIKGKPVITIELSPDVDKTEVTDLWPLILKYQKLFGRKRKQKAPKRIPGKRLRTSSKDLDLYAEVAELHRQGWDDIGIWRALNDRYDYDFGSIRGFVREAKKLGFV